MKKYLILITIILLVLVSKAQNDPKCFIEDLNKLVGSWQGSLTYLDYSSGKPYTMTANVNVLRIGNTNKFSFSNIYPKETNANSIDTISLSTDGRYIGRESVKSRKELSNGDVEIITEEIGTDGNDNKKAIIRHTYILGKTTFDIRKEVKFDRDKDWIKRDEYFYTR